MSFNYADQFSQFLAQKYEKELTSYDLQTSNPQVQFINAHTIKLPRLTLSGYKDHTRAGAYNSGTLTNDWEPKTLAHDRDIEYIIDPMDIDETNLVLAVANIQNVFETEHAIPEKDTVLFIHPGFPVQTTQCEIIGLKTTSFDIHDFRGDKLIAKMEEFLKKTLHTLRWTSATTFRTLTKHLIRLLWHDIPTTTFCQSLAQRHSVMPDSVLA